MCVSVVGNDIDVSDVVVGVLLLVVLKVAVLLCV